VHSTNLQLDLKIEGKMLKKALSMHLPTQEMKI